MKINKIFPEWDEQELVPPGTARLIFELSGFTKRSHPFVVRAQPGGTSSRLSQIFSLVRGDQIITRAFARGRVENAFS
jgi:hypothetical protein